MRIYLDMIGCRLNQAEIETIAHQFRLAGHEIVSSPEQADLAVINTCTVTAQADSDSRQKLRQVARKGVQHIVATGCWATLHADEAAGLPAVRNVIPNRRKDWIVPDLLRLPLAAFDLEPLERQPLPGLRQRTRAFIKAQDGCNNHCTYCITTLARGPARSQPLKAVLKDITRANRGGAKEVVLTGVHLGAWGQDFDPPQHLSQLIRAVLSETDIPRLRLSSLEPWDLDAEFFSLWRDPRLCRHLHLPLQSGCAATLQRMGRKTTPESFANLVQNARAAIPSVAITTDMMVGFPGESEDEFAESIAFVETIQFAAGHVFPYSERPGTAAVQLPNPVPHALKKERSSRMRHILSDSAFAYRGQFLGRVSLVLWESAQPSSPHGWEVSGLTDNYLRVTAISPNLLSNQITPAVFTALLNNGLQGELIESSTAIVG